MDVYYYIDVGDEVLDRRDLRRKGRVIAVIHDGKLSKSFYVVRWDNNVEELVVLEDLCSLREMQKQEELYNVKRSSKVKIEEENIYNEIQIGESSDWLKVASELLKVGFDENEIIQLIKNGKLVVRENRFTGELEDIVLLLADGSKIFFKLEGKLSMPVKKHYDYGIGRVERIVNKENQDVDVEEFRKKSFSDEVVIKKVPGGFGIEFGDSELIFISKDDLRNFIIEFGFDEKEVISSVKEKGYYKGCLKFNKDLKNLFEDEI